MNKGMNMLGEYRFPGGLFFGEGSVGSGMSTQQPSLKKWLESEPYVVYFSECNSALTYSYGFGEAV